jgi:predicted nucleotidyltransferase
MDIPVWSPSYTRVFAVLSRYAGEVLSKRDIAKRAGIAPMSVSNAVRVLEEEGRVTVSRFKTIDRVSLDLSDERTVGVKRAENLKRIILSGLVEELERSAPHTTIILFGSYSFGEDVSTSDIDIAIIGRSSVDPSLERFEQELFRAIHVSAFESWDDIDPYLKNSILSGIVLSGRVMSETA